MTVRATLTLVVVLAACSSGLPEPTGDRQLATMPADPSGGCRPGAAEATRGERRELAVGGERRGYLVDAPAHPTDEPLPVVFAFHGFRGSAGRFRWWNGLAALSGRERVLVVHPEGHDDVRLLDTTGRGWDFRPEDTRDTEFVRALLDTLEQRHCIDRRRVYATGMSNGGFFASLLGCALADRLAAVASVAGGMPLAGCRPARPVGVLLLYGSADHVVPPYLIRGAREWWAHANGCGTPVEREGCLVYGSCDASLVACEGTQGHWWPTDATPHIWRFFTTQARGAGFAAG